MTTALTHRSATAVPPRTGALRRVGQLRQSSPGRLQLIRAALVTLAVLTGLIAGLTAASATAGTSDLRDRAQPLLVEAETIYSALADADTTAAQAFLAGGLEPVRLTERYEADLARATTSLASAARLTPEGSAASRAVEALATGTTRYAALVATARAVNRQGLPVGASYLATASQLNRETLQPEAKALFQLARKEVDSGYSAARSSWWLMLLLTVFVLLTIMLIWSQLYLSRTTNRTFNVPLVAATGLAALLMLTSGFVFSGQRDMLSTADQDGSAPVAALAESRILLLRERADEALTLAARAGNGPHEKDFQATREQLTFDDESLDGFEWNLREIREQHQVYLDLHEKVRELDDGGDYDGAVKLAVGEGATTAFENVLDSVDNLLDDRKHTFDEHIREAGSGLGTLTWLGPLLALAIGVLAVFGLRARLEEYR
ncbi:hypothetical protein [Actinoplanes aureus]|uniref:Secreted protein n=1 Tax=Actinoplanes aureus TaxID=2792083 RepID=A0A931CCI5_9ACTN|nr:hypothetical protein [Actinoplanes aureus]MBG0567395.1 hypothetical protein [Actinoplanes aureus]